MKMNAQTIRNAPKEIYVQQNKKSGRLDDVFTEPIWEDTHNNIKYIRSDIAELTWEDISRIRNIMFEVNKGVDHESPLPNDKSYCEEVLKRYNNEY